MLLRKLKTDITLLKHVFIGTLFMLTLTCISCREGALSVTDEGYVPIEFSAHLRGDAPTRTHFTASDADLLISWEEDETVDVLLVERDNLIRFTISEVMFATSLKMLRVNTLNIMNIFILVVRHITTLRRKSKLSSTSASNPRWVMEHGLT